MPSAHATPAYAQQVALQQQQQYAHAQMQALMQQQHALAAQQRALAGAVATAPAATHHQPSPQQQQMMMMHQQQAMVQQQQPNGQPGLMMMPGLGAAPPMMPGQQSHIPDVNAGAPGGSGFAFMGASKPNDADSFGFVSDMIGAKR